MAMEQFLECPICCDIATDAVESQCCNKIFCRQCVKELDFTKFHNNDSKAVGCPLCRASPFVTKPSALARRMIGIMPVECPYKCGNNKVTRDSLATHMKQCPNKPTECSFNNCKFSGALKDYTKHIIETHSDSIPDAFDAYNKRSNYHYNNNNGDEKKDENDNNNKNNNGGNDKVLDPVITRTNSRGKTARLGKTGKYYCGKQFVKFDCKCCNGYCGPTNGCNCYSCMELDVETRKLGKGYLVNRKGFVSRVSNKTGKFYCGRKVGVLGSYHDGYCGPTNGPNCQSCQYLDFYAPKKYSNLV